MLHSTSDLIERDKFKSRYQKPSLQLISPDDLPDCVKISFYTIKYIHLNDSTSNYRTKFAELAVKGAIINSYKMVFDILPRTFEKMDLLILSGNDVDRLHSFLKINQPLLIQTPKIVLSNALAPSKRAELLKLGYDDVVNMKNSTPAEFCARALSCLRRYQITKNSSGDELFINSISNVCNFSKLTSSQRRVIHALIESLGNFSSYGHLCSMASKTNVRVSNEHLRVLIHEIRPALKSGYTINSVYGEGYRLSKET